MINHRVVCRVHPLTMDDLLQCSDTQEQRVIEVCLQAMNDDGIDLIFTALNQTF